MMVKMVIFLIVPSTHQGIGICKSQLLTLFTRVCTHSSIRFYRRCKRHSITTKFMKSQQFPRLTGKNDHFSGVVWTICKNKQHRNLTEYYPKLVSWNMTWLVFLVLKCSYDNEDNYMYESMISPSKCIIYSYWVTCSICVKRIMKLMPHYFLKLLFG